MFSALAIASRTKSVFTFSAAVARWFSRILAISIPVYCIYISKVILRLSRLIRISSTIWLMRSSTIISGTSNLALATAASINAFSYSTFALFSAFCCIRSLYEAFSSATVLYSLLAATYSSFSSGSSLRFTS